jgi:hypothetical protein
MDASSSRSNNTGDFFGQIPRKKKVPAATATNPEPPQFPQPAERDVPIPRKKKNNQPPPSEQQQQQQLSSHYHHRHRDNESDRVQILSEDPFLVRISIRGVPLTSGIPTNLLQQLQQPQYTRDAQRNGDATTAAKRTTSSSLISTMGLRSPAKRQRSEKSVSYQELEDTDSDDFLTEAEEQQLLEKRLKKKRKKRATTTTMNTTPPPSEDDNTTTNMDLETNLPPLDAYPQATATAATSEHLLESQAPVLSTRDGGGTDPNAIEAPPPGALSSLWYSRECFLHVFVLDKICGWKTRPKVQLVSTQVVEEQNDQTGPPHHPVVSWDHIEAQRLQQKALSSETVWSHPKKRMEVSRIHPEQCPVIMGMAAVQSPQKYKVQTVPDSREEVVLVKWRGRSYLHCSWERASDVQKLDTSTSSTARHKIRRFYQSQEQMYGIHWRIVLEEERATAASIHSHGAVAGNSLRVPAVTTTTSEGAATTADGDGDQVDEYFSPQCLEVERILACDENEMNMQVLAKQRAINLKREQAEEDQKEMDSHWNVDKWNLEQLVGEPEAPWDPEDNVRYVVKWKGLPYVDITWEYWRDIKRDAVDEAEDFWYRQRAPDLEEVRQLTNRPHPHIREFHKLKESPSYGLSRRSRPIASLDDNDTTKTVAAASDSDPGFTLRSYQLEGVNWLLFNWWNRRSCILADEMVRCQ